MLQRSFCFEDYTIRLMTEADLRMVLQWRNTERVRMNMYSDGVIAWKDHYAWFSRVRDNQAFRYFIVELRQRPIGVVSFTDIDRIHNKCNWGFYLGETDVPRGSGTALGILGLTEAFEYLNIRKVCAEVFAFNEASLRFHSRLGFAQEGYLSRHVWKNDKYEDIVLFACFNDQWDVVKERLLKMFA